MSKNNNNQIFLLSKRDNFEPVKINNLSDSFGDYQIYSDETGVYDIGKVDGLSKNNPVVLVPVSKLSPWLEGKEWGDYSPRDVLNNPEKYPEEMKDIKNADLEYPIFIYKDMVIDGNHRLAKAVLEGKESIKAKIITDEQMEQARDKEVENEEEFKLSKRAAKKKHDGAMIALMVPKDIVKKMREVGIVKNKEIYNVLHMTLLYLG